MQSPRSVSGATTAIVATAGLLVVAPPDTVSAQPLFDVHAVQGWDTSGGGTATGTSNGVGWTLSPTFIWGAITVLNGTYGGYADGIRFDPPLPQSDTLHIGVETFDLTFDETIVSALVYMTDNPSPPTDGRIDFGITPTRVSGDVNISGTTFWAGSSDGGLVRLDNIHSNVLSHTVPGSGGLTFAIVVTVPEPAALPMLVASVLTTSRWAGHRRRART